MAKNTLYKLVFEFEARQKADFNAKIRAMEKAFYGPTEAVLKYAGAISVATDEGKELLRVSEQISAKLKTKFGQFKQGGFSGSGPAANAGLKEYLRLEKNINDSLKYRETIEARIARMKENQINKARALDAIENRKKLVGADFRARNQNQYGSLQEFLIMRHFEGKTGILNNVAKQYELLKAKSLSFLNQNIPLIGKMNLLYAHTNEILTATRLLFVSMLREIPVIGYGLARIVNHLSAAKLAAAAGVVGAGIGLAWLSSKAFQAASEFQVAWAKVTTILEDSSGAVSFFRHEVLRMSRDLPENAASIARGLYQTLSSGFLDAAEALKLTKVASKAAVAGYTDTFTAVDALTTVLNSYQLSADQAGKISDQMFRTIVHGKLEFKDLAEHIGKAIPFFAQAGIAAEEFFAALATLTQGGLRTNIAVTALRGVIAQVIKPTDTAISLANSLGIEFNSAAIASKGLQGWLQELAEKTKLNDNLISTLFPDVRGLTAVLQLYGKMAQRNALILDDLRNATGATDLAFLKMTDTAEAQWKIFKNKLNVEMIAFGDTLINVVTPAIRKYNEAHSELSTKVQLASGASFQLRKELLPLAKEYYTLSFNTNRSAEEQKRLATVIKEIARIFPGVTEKVNVYGEAIKLSNADLAERLHTSRRESAEERQRLVEEVKKKIGYRKREMESLERLIDLNRKFRLSEAGEPFLKSTAKNFDRLAASIREVGLEIKDLEAILEILAKSEHPEAFFETMSEQLAKVIKSPRLTMEQIYNKQAESGLKEVLLKQGQENLTEIFDFVQTKLVGLGLPSFTKSAAGFEAFRAWYKNEANDAMRKILDELFTDFKKELDKKKLVAQQTIVDFMKDMVSGAGLVSIEKMDEETRMQLLRYFESLAGTDPEMVTRIKDAAALWEKARKDQIEKEIKAAINIIPNLMQRFEEEKAVGRSREEQLKLYENQIDSIFNYFKEKFEITVGKEALETWFTNLDEGTKLSLRDAANAYEVFKENIEANAINIAFTGSRQGGGPYADPELAFQELFKNNTTLGGILLGDINELNPVFDILHKHFNRLLDQFKSLSPVLADIIDSFSSMLSTLNLRTIAEEGGLSAKNLGKNIIESIKGGLISGGISLGVSFISKLGGGKTISDIFFEQREHRKLLEEIAENLKAVPTTEAAQLRQDAETLRNFLNAPFSFRKRGPRESESEYARAAGEAQSAYRFKQKIAIRDFFAKHGDLLETLGITLPEDITRLTDQQLQDIISKINEYFKSFGITAVDTLEDIMENWETLADLMDISDPIARWEFFKKLLREATDPGANSLAKLLDAFKNPVDLAQLGGLLSRFAQGGGFTEGGTLTPDAKAALAEIARISGLSMPNLLAIFRSLGLSEENFQELLNSINSMGDATAGAIDELTDTTIGVTRNVTITEQQGFTIIAVLNSIFEITKRLIGTLEAISGYLMETLVPRVGGGQQLVSNGPDGRQVGTTLTISNLSIYANDAAGGRAAATAFARDTEQRLRSMGLKVVGQNIR